MQGTLHKTVTEWLVIYCETTDAGRIHHKQVQLNPADVAKPEVENGAHINFRLDETLDETSGRRSQVATLINS